VFVFVFVVVLVLLAFVSVRFSCVEESFFPKMFFKLYDGVMNIEPIPFLVVVAGLDVFEFEFEFAFEFDWVGID